MTVWWERDSIKFQKSNLHLFIFFIFPLRRPIGICAYIGVLYIMTGVIIYNTPIYEKHLLNHLRFFKTPITIKKH